MSRAVVQVQIPKLLDRQPPVAPEAEAAVLGSLLLDPACIAEVSTVIESAECFYTEANQAVYRGLMELGDKHGSADVMLLAQRLQDTGKLDAVGGPDYLIQLANTVPSAANALHYAGIVADKHRLRRLITAAGETLHDVYENNQAVGEDAQSVVARAEQRVCEISASQPRHRSAEKSMGELATDHIRDLMDREANPAPLGIRTGFDELDHMIKAGLRPGQVIIIGGRPSMGKTTLALNIGEQVATGKRQMQFHEPETKAPVGVFSLEMSKEELFERWIAAEARVPQDRYAGGDIKEHEWDSVLAAARDIQTAQLYIDDTPSITVHQLRTRARAMVRKHGVRLIIIDFLQLMTVTDPRNKNRNEQVSEISRGIKAIAKELKIPIIVCAALNRGAENRDGNRPRLSDLRESGSIESDADIVILVHREAYYHKDDPEWMPHRPEFNELNREKLRHAELIIAKQRNGPTGVADLDFIAEETRFRNRK